MALIAISYAMPGVVGGEQKWTDEMAEQYEKASNKFHAAQHNVHTDVEEHDHGEEGETSKAELEQARQEFLAEKEKLESAQSRGKGLAGVLWWLGAACGLVGMAAYFTQRSD